MTMLIVQAKLSIGYSGILMKMIGYLLLLLKEAQCTIVNNVEVNIADRKNPKSTIIPFVKGIMKAYRERFNDRSCPGAGPGGLLRPSPHPALGVGGAILGAAFKM